MFEAFSKLPKFYNAKLFELIDKISYSCTTLSSSIILAFYGLFKHFPKSNLDVLLKDARAFKDWHRSLEDFVDDMNQNIRDKLVRLGEIAFEESSRNRAIKEFMSEHLKQAFDDSPSRPVDAQRNLQEMIKIIQSNAYAIEEKDNVPQTALRSTVIPEPLISTQQRPSKPDIPHIQSSQVQPSPKRSPSNHLPNSAIDHQPKPVEPAPSRSPVVGKIENLKRDSGSMENGYNASRSKSPKRTATVKLNKKLFTDREDAGRPEPPSAVIKNVRVVKGVISSTNFLYHVVLSSGKDWVVSAGKDLPLVKWTYKGFKKIKESAGRFKSIALIIDGRDRLWLHDALSRDLIVFDSAAMKELRRFEGRAIRLYYQEDLVVSKDKSLMAWYQGEGNLVVIDVESLAVVKKINYFTVNTVIRKLVPLFDLSQMVSLEIAETEDQNNVLLNNYSIDDEKSLNTIEYADLNQSNQLCKSIAASKNGKFLFAAGVYRPKNSQEMGYLSAHNIVKGFREEATVTSEENSIPSKPGFYRISRLETADVLVVGGWTDIHIFTFESLRFEKVIYLPSVHENLIYNIMVFENTVFTCSDDCSINLIELD